MKKSEKTFFVQNLTQELKAASSVVLVDYSGLDVKSQQELQRKLSEVEAKMLVVKNTLFKLAGKAAKVAEETLTDTVLSGPTALVITEADPIAPIQVIGAFAKKHDLPQIKVGIYEGDFQDKDAILRLANLPGKEALVAQVIGGIAAPMYALNFTLKSNMQKLIYILEKASKKEAN